MLTVSEIFVKVREIAETESSMPEKIVVPALKMYDNVPPFVEME